MAGDRTKDQEMAQRLKAIGEERRSGRCCICYQIVPLTHTYIHLTAHCQGPRRKGSRA